MVLIVVEARGSPLSASGDEPGRPESQLNPFTLSHIRAHGSRGKAGRGGGLGSNALGFAVHGERVVWRDDSSSLERLALHALRVPLPFDAVEFHGSKGRVKTPLAPRTGGAAAIP